MAHKKIKSRKKQPDIFMILSIVLAILLIGSVFTWGFRVTPVGKKNIEEKTADYISVMVQGQVLPIIDSVEIEHGLYKVSIDLGGEKFDSYVTLDGKMLFPQGLEMEPSEDEMTDTTETVETPDVVKSDKPEVELFVMSHCPYGTQAEKGMIPVAKELGDKIDFEIKFVYYAMHGKTELDEQSRQVCIKDEQESKYFDYLECFLEEGKSEECLTEAEVDIEMLDSCVEELDSEYKITELYNDESTWLSGRFPLFNVYKEENDEYGIGGSPTLVVNGQQVQSGRSPESYLQTICAAFNDVPEECELELDSAIPPAGFGYEGSGTNSGSC